MVKGEMNEFAFVGEKIGFEFEAAVDLDDAGEIADNPWENTALVVGGVLLFAGAVILVVGTLVEDVVTLGAGVADDPISFATAAVMVMKAGRIFRTYGVSVYRNFSRSFITSAGVTVATPMAAAESSEIYKK